MNSLNRFGDHTWTGGGVGVWGGGGGGWGGGGGGGGDGGGGGGGWGGWGKRRGQACPGRSSIRPR
jgi:hypothetical protein